ncbi:MULTISPECIES: prepilin peptidase [unclassified Sphingomonas]|uniref:A24 family peptidase n=1 Tax=unclassified Sphingomonas TaxID=196159 RepID=UPI001D11B371|nr:MULTISPECIES: prepilin peptidase [unclassified Sphingomonas]MCC2979125.1 prepilin peptidase [Sphingomonas sp. IC4-52]MCD2315641.1 prepilin peptidase [Sphingomonas sp. IC-11]
MGLNFLSWALPVILGLLLLSAGIEDARVREIANWKNATIALLAPLWWFAIGIAPWPGMVVQIGVALVVLVLFCVAFHFGQMGGGDVKLIAALALWMPVGALVQLLLVMSIIGGALTIVMLIDHRIRKNSGNPEIPYGVAIAIAGLIGLREPLLNHFT